MSKHVLLSFTSENIDKIVIKNKNKVTIYATVDDSKSHFTMFCETPAQRDLLYKSIECWLSNKEVLTYDISGE